MTHTTRLGRFAGLAAITLAIGVAAPVQPAQAGRPAGSEAIVAAAAFARAHHLTGLSPASLSSVSSASGVRLGCRGLSPASAQDCPSSAFDLAAS